MLERDNNTGVLIDGFPRTEIQVELLKLLYDKMIDLRQIYLNSKFRDRFRRPSFRICVLYVDETTSVERQLKRGLAARSHNQRVKATGEGRLVTERQTDFDPVMTKQRYKIFMDHYSSLLQLRKHFPFHLIDATRSIDDVLKIILKEFEYQSSLELDQPTFDAIQYIPLASQVGVNARRELIRRLENYQMLHSSLFRKAISFIEKDVAPSIKRHAISGSTIVRSEIKLLDEEHIIDMIIDILSERGYHVTYDSKTMIIPLKVEPHTLQIVNDTRKIHMFKITFMKHILRKN
ncbi:Adenylate kinase domain-containing protein [Rozella allomycis CSF55]|uniref:Adenylate kinase domain-containing protein n=1 Tax=Rozella allomycis (strain CSF55) TaxID=988480 RepID=A0A075AQ29_ROZAC|nr:Adenylate kinase domain-containing protein [Rozella allomycis CSF55]|eukprot:EPZ32346.1 Adenylate kinase domain-containing protein [Rozella allomycis CSF55]